MDGIRRFPIADGFPKPTSNGGQGNQKKKSQDRVSHLKTRSVWESPKNKSGTATLYLLTTRPVSIEYAIMRD
jgi:hypothetical protein